MTNAPVTVSILATEDTSLSTLFGLSDVLRSVGSAWEVFVSGTPSTPMFDVRIVTATLGPLRCANGVVVSPDMAFAERRADRYRDRCELRVAGLAPTARGRACAWRIRRMPGKSAIFIFL